MDLRVRRRVRGHLVQPFPDPPSQRKSLLAQWSEFQTQHRPQELPTSSSVWSQTEAGMLW